MATSRFPSALNFVIFLFEPGIEARGIFGAENDDLVFSNFELSFDGYTQVFCGFGGSCCGRRCGYAPGPSLTRGILYDSTWILFPIFDEPRSSELIDLISASPRYRCIARSGVFTTQLLSSY